MAPYAYSASHIHQRPLFLQYGYSDISQQDLQAHMSGGWLQNDAACRAQCHLTTRYGIDTVLQPGTVQEPVPRTSQGQFAAWSPPSFTDTKCVSSKQSGSGCNPRNPGRKSILATPFLLSKRVKHQAVCRDPGSCIYSPLKLPFWLIRTGSLALDCPVSKGFGRYHTMVITTWIRYHWASMEQNYALIQRVLVTWDTIAVIRVEEKAALATISRPAYFPQQLLIDNSSEAVRTRPCTTQPPTKEQSKSESCSAMDTNTSSPCKLCWGTMTPKERLVIRDARYLNLCCWGNEPIHVAEGHIYLFICSQEKNGLYSHSL